MQRIYNQIVELFSSHALVAHRTLCKENEENNNKNAPLFPVILCVIGVRVIEVTSCAIYQQTASAVHVKISRLPD